MTTTCFDINESSLSHVFELVSCVKYTVDEVVCHTIELTKWFRLVYEGEKGKEPFYYNILHDCERNSEKILETIHSKILFGLLSHPALRESFIKFFFPEIEFEAGKTMLHSPDQRRIDLAIRGVNFFIIIENKINRAQEQPNQVGNYVDRAIKCFNHKISEVYVLYLDLDSRNGPSLFSLSDNKREDLGNRLVCKNYKDDIIEWLTKVEQGFDFTTEPYLQRNLLIYKDYLEDKCNTVNRDNNMNAQIDKKLEEKLSLDDMDLSKKIEKLKDELENVAKLQERLSAIQQKYEEELFREWYSEIADKLSSKGVRLTSDEEYFAKFEFCFNQKPYSCVIGREGKRFYWGIRVVDKTSIDLYDFETIRDIVLNMGFQNHEGNSAEWVISDYASNDEIVERFITLSEVIVEKAKSEPQRVSLL